MRQRLLEEHFVSSGRTCANRTRENAIGRAAEQGFSRLSGLEAPEFRPDRNHDDGYDFLAMLGDIDVKGVAKKPWFIGVKDTALQKYPGAALYALMFCPIDEPTAQLAGFVTRDEIERGPHVPHVLDPRGRQAWKREAGSRDITPMPGRWLPVEALHCPFVLVEAIRRDRISVLGQEVRYGNQFEQRKLRG